MIDNLPSLDTSIVFWILVYVVALATSVRVIIDTHSSTKTAAYILLILLVPIVGTIVYFTLGVNYRKNRIYKRKLIENKKLFDKIKSQIETTSDTIKDENPELIGNHTDIVDLLVTESLSPLTLNNVKLLINGEQKFPEVIKSLEGATNHIHLEYYIFENDNIGNQIKDILIAKAKEGVEVRLIYDAFGSMSFRKTVKLELERYGVLVKPFFQIRFPHFGSRINFRNHRKIIVVDGIVGYTGGINISDRYINSAESNSYWRDTHIKIEGGAVHSLQYHFLSSWYFCSEEKLSLSAKYFPRPNSNNGEHLVQIVSSGPDQKRASNMLAYFTTIVMARKCVYLATPYLIPNESISNALKKAALSGKDVRIIIPARSDSKIVGAASEFYFEELMDAGVRIFLYEKGFIHCKTLVVDDRVSIVGTANMDFRSFDLNFEINAVVYGTLLNTELKQSFMVDLAQSTEVDPIQWGQRNRFKVLMSALARIFSPIL